MCVRVRACVRACVCLRARCTAARSRLNRCSLSLQARLPGTPGQTAFPCGPTPASAGLQVRTVLGDLGEWGGTMDLHCSAYCPASMQVTSLGWKSLPEAGLFSLRPRAWSRRERGPGLSRGLDHLHRLEGSARPRLTNGLGPDQTT